jgi:hypothetical protein
VEIVPPIKAFGSVGSGRYVRPFFESSFSRSVSLTPGWRVAIRFFSFIPIILFRFSVEMTHPPKGILAPVTPVPPPDIVTGLFHFQAI